MAYTAVFDNGASTVLDHPCRSAVRIDGPAASIYRHGDGATGLHVAGWDVFVTDDKVVVRRMEDKTSRLCLKDCTPDKDPEMYGPVAEITVGRTRNNVWPSTATTFLTGKRELT